MKEASTCKPVRCLSWALCTPQPVLLAPVQQQTSYFARRTATVFTREYAISIAETCALLQPYKTLCFYLFSSSHCVLVHARSVLVLNSNCFYTKCLKIQLQASFAELRQPSNTFYNFLQSYISSCRL